MSYTQLYYHLVWRTYYSEPSIPESHKHELDHQREDTRSELMRMLTERDMDPGLYFEDNW
ncbi:MAG: hypothetical protein LIP02_03095 [Bacteroidales bacterium]|nr:hypothetical protein [Bacteroidales bacterium]